MASSSSISFTPRGVSFGSVTNEDGTLLVPVAPLAVPFLLSAFALEQEACLGTCTSSMYPRASAIRFL